MIIDEYPSDYPPEYPSESEYPSRPRRKQQTNVNIDYGYAAPGCAWVLGVPSLVILVALYTGADWASHTILAVLWVYLMWFFALIVVPCAAVIGWHFYKAKKRHEYEQAKRRGEQRLLKAQSGLMQQTSLLVQEARLNNDNVDIQLQYNESGVLKGQSIRIMRAAVIIEQAQIEALGRVQIAEQRQAQIGQRAGGVNGYLPAPADEPPDEKPVPVPVAPNFWDIVDLITTDRMPLCFVVDTDPRSRTYMQTVPAFGTILDLLSLCIIGKPGRGKSVSLLFYICILARYGSEIHVLDPQGAFKELQLLHGKPLPAMPPTARIYYYSDLEEMERAVSNILGEIKDREKLHKPHIDVNGELQLHTVKHPLVILADELPILAEMDAEIKSRMKEENKARKEEGLDKLEVRQVTQLVKTAVLAARKYAVYFVGASQSIDATILPTRVSAGFNSRIVFYSEVQKARMAGLESEIAKRLLPVIRRAGPGMTIYDCSRWDEPLIAAFPNVTIEDVLEFFGVSMDELKALWVAELAAADRQSRITGPLTVDASPAVLPKRATRRASFADAVEVWNGFDGEIGRPRLREELQKRGLECSDDLAKNLLRAIKQQ